MQNLEITSLSIIFEQSVNVKYIIYNTNVLKVTLFFFFSCINFYRSQN